MDTILFDLDGTLLPMDTDLFIKIYFGEIANAFKDIIDPKKIIESMNISITDMVKNTDKIRNEEVFMSKFGELIDIDSEIYLKRFEEFYETTFHTAKKSTYQSEFMRKSVDLLKQKGYKIVVATNPLFPMRANHHRIEWAGFKVDEFDYISSFESNSYCKPNIEYYQEVLEAIDKKPNDCMMVGNDALEDMIAGKLGIKTYLVTDHLLNKHDVEISSDYEGKAKDFYEFVKTLENIK